MVRIVMYYARLFRPHPSLRDTFPTRGKASFGCADAFESAFEIRWGGIKVSTARPPSSGASRHLPPRRGRLLGCCAAFDCTFACFALIRRWRATFPTRGKASFGCANLFCSASQFYRNLTFKSALYLTVTNRRSSLPRVGKVSRQRRMRAKSARGTTSRNHPAAVAFPFEGEGGAKRRMRAGGRRKLFLPPHRIQTLSLNLTESP